VITSNLKQVRQALEKAGKGLDDSARNCRDEMMNTLIQLSKEEIVGRRPKGQKATSGRPPMNRTGNLRRSIRGEKYKVGFGKYQAIVGPTIIYGRRVELGGGNWPSGTRFPYMAPAYAKFRVIAPTIIRKHLAIGGK
jgi:hypothetical protein